MLRRAITLSVMALVVFTFSAPALDVEITGTFNMNFVSGAPGADLLGILGHSNSWSISLQGVQFACEQTFCSTTFSDYKVRQLFAASSSFQFGGPDATLLNNEVGQYFTHGGLQPNNAYLQVDSAACYGFQRMIFYIFPDNGADGVRMQVDATVAAGTFAENPDGCPVIDSFVINADQVILFDLRGDNDGNIAALNSGTIAIETPIPVDGSSWGRIKAIYK